MFPFSGKLNFDLVQKAGALINDFNEFFPFCKTHSDVSSYKCEIIESKWGSFSEDRSMTFYITADRFLRGMVRLIVGMCLNVGLGKISLEDVRESLEIQKQLKKSWSVPPEGLFLTKVEYPENLRSPKD